MQHAAFPTKLLLLASLPAFVSSCADRQRPTVAISSPVDLLTRPDEPQFTAEALTSEEAYERTRDAQIEWGRANAGVIDRACRWLKSAGVKLDCR